MMWTLHISSRQNNKEFDFNMYFWNRWRDYHINLWAASCSRDRIIRCMFGCNTRTFLPVILICYNKNVSVFIYFVKFDNCLFLKSELCSLFFRRRWYWIRLRGCWDCSTNSTVEQLHKKTGVCGAPSLGALTTPLFFPCTECAELKTFG